MYIIRYQLAFDSFLLCFIISWSYLQKYFSPSTLKGMYPFQRTKN